MSPKKSMADKAARGKNLTQRNALTAEVQTFVPQHGLVFLSGGLVSTSRRLTVDLDNKTLVVYEGGYTGQSAISSLPEKMKKSLSQSELDHVRAQFDKIWKSSETYLNTPPVADWDVRLILADGNTIRDIDSYGPPKSDVKSLYDYLWGMEQDGQLKKGNRSGQ